MRINASRFLIPYLLIIALLSIFTFFLYPHVAKAADPVFSSDDFNACSLNTGLWTFTDPLSDATVEATGYHVEISVPAGNSHDPWVVNNAARIMQPADNTDFEIEVKFDSALSDAYQEQGIFVEEDSNRFLRFDFYSDGSNTSIFAASFSGGSGLGQINSVIAGTNVAPMWLRVKREGDQWTESYSFDGLNWTPSGTFTYALTVNSVGVFAGNDGDPESSTPAHTAQVDYFFNTASPITPEDANPVYTLNVTTVGNGAVEKDPSPFTVAKRLN